MDWRAENRAAPHRTAHRFKNARGEPGVVSLGRKLKDIARAADLAQ